MVYLIIGLAMLFILGPIFMLRPSPRERRLARIRQYAMEQKVVIRPVSLLKEEQFKKLQQRNPHIDQFKWFRYQLVAEQEDIGPSVKGRWTQRKTKDGVLVWEAEDIRQETPSIVEALLQQWQQNQSEDFLQLELGPRNVCVVWSEAGDLPEVETLCQQLHSLMVV